MYVVLLYRTYAESEMRKDWPAWWCIIIFPLHLKKFVICLGKWLAWLLVTEEGREKLSYFDVYNALPCIICTHVFGPNFQGKQSFILIFNSIIYVFILRSKTNDRVPGYILHTDIIIVF